MGLDKRDLRARKKMLGHCQEVHEDDGVDPREFFQQDKKSKGGGRKTAQLCAQVAEALSFALSGDFDDELLHNLQVVSVAPAPDASQLLVILRADAAGEPGDLRAIYDRLAAVEGRLRFEVAAAITRKRAPRLLFQVIGGSGSSEVRP